jgi:hypothetical protein
MSFGFNKLWKKVDVLRMTIKKIENDILQGLIEEIGNSDYEFEDQNRNITAKCCVCNNKPEYSLIVCGEFTHVYFCCECRKNFNGIMNNNIKATTVEELKTSLKEYSDFVTIYRPCYDENFEHSPLHLDIFFVYVNKDDIIITNNIDDAKLKNYEKCLVLLPNPCNENPMMPCMKKSTCQTMTVGILRDVLNNCSNNVKILKYSKYSNLGEYRKINLQPWTVYIDKTGKGSSIQDIQDFSNYYDSDDDIKISNYEKHVCLF